MSNESVGELLAEARRKLGKSIKEIELETKIRVKYVEALERNDFDFLPGDIYTRGFIKTYATYLGLDPEPVVQLYKDSRGPQDTCDLAQMSSSNMRIATKERPPWFIPAIILGVVATGFVLLIAWGAIVSSMSKDQRVVVQDIKTRTSPDTTVAGDRVTGSEKATASKSSESEDEPATDSSTTTSTTTTTVPEEDSEGDGKIDVTIKLTGINGEGSWVRVKVDGEKEFEGVIEPGVSKQFEGDETVEVRAGNSPGLEVMLNGKKQPELETASSGIANKTFKKENK